ncbi:AAA family ATPase [Methylovulum psychrotolerans]|uniref:ATP-binding protein n=1 Tax=Methylovulum psychrotolerans TaxID=1704499 RepID=UPI001BFF3E7C|nr:YhaN family protein [Methylovulum psychrotolerans]MBT9098433.1 AAA family ATPase [Methylovulum psychrotolerans]
MRFQRVDLIKYGKFSDRSVGFPAAQYDFHLIVGPNEAGKSTLRSAIVDLLFGIPPRSTLNFVHPLNELRLGAHINNASGALEFHRAKAQKQTLRSPADAVLPEAALVPFIGTADRHFFDQMFGLDHTRLIAGGNSILNAENDVGQILFQSAAGVASLGKIRDALLTEASHLWAPRKSAERAYYIAADQLDKATAALKEATVRTKVWVEAHHKVEALQQQLSDERDRHQQLQSQRNSLERIRRLAPYLAAIRDNEQQLAELGAVIELPGDAAAILSASERELAVARQLLALRTGEAEKTQAALGQIPLDEAVLAMAADISKLDNLRQQYSPYSRDIERRKNEIALLWQNVADLCAQLGWQPESESAISLRLPKQLVQRELRRQAHSHGGIIQALRAAEKAESNKLAEIDGLSKQLASLCAGEIKSALRAALAKAKSLGDVDTASQKQQGKLAKAQAALADALAALGAWQKPLAELLAMQPPSQTRINRLLQERRELVADQKAALSRLNSQKAEVGRIGIEISQFQELHHPTTHEAVLYARHERDALWLAMKAGENTLQEAAPRFEVTLRQADLVADRRLDDVGEATELQSLEHQLEREQHNLSMIDGQYAELGKVLQAFDGAWAEQAAGLGLLAMPLEELGAWLGKREKVLAAALVCQEAQSELDLTADRVAQAQLGLSQALRETGLAVSDDDNLAVLTVQAERFIQDIDDANVRRDTLAAQLLTAQTLAATLKQATDGARAEEHRWIAAWSDMLAKAGLAADSALGAVEDALELIGLMEEKLSKMRQIRVERIDTMNADLKAFSADAQRLAQSLAPELNAAPTNEIAIELASRLAQARAAYAERERLTEMLRVANAQVGEANESIQTATANLRPLMERAGVDSCALLAEAIARSDDYRHLQAKLAEAKATFLNGGDGLSQVQIEAEIDAADLVRLVAELAKIDAELADTVEQQTGLSANLANAARLLADIGGSDAAAQAEGQRQEALAKMSEVAERYVKVLTAGHLLRWSIDRYRQDKQGPLLGRAGAIFSTLTSGAFLKLVVDFERVPMVLEGLRADGKLVGIAGMSDGTRDQLYLALRLAALEMHLEQTLPLPFIADDLFINYDDVRAKAGFEALKSLSAQTQVIFLSHHDHLIPTVQAVFGQQVNIVFL